MQIFLLAVTVILCIVLYRMLSSQRATYPFVRTTQLLRTEEQAAYSATEAEHGLITIDRDMVIVEGQEYSLKNKKGKDPEAWLSVSDGKLISVGVRMQEGEKFFYIDPEHNLFSAPYTGPVPNAHQHHVFSF